MPHLKYKTSYTNTNSRQITILSQSKRFFIKTNAKLKLLFTNSMRNIMKMLNTHPTKGSYQWFHILLKIFILYHYDGINPKMHDLQNN